MHHPTLLEGALVALVLSLSVSPLVVFVQLAIGSLLAWKIGVMGLAYTYLCYLLARNGRRSGDAVHGAILPCRPSKGSPAWRGVHGRA